MEYLFRSRLMKSIPLGFKRGIVDLINSEKRKRIANGMSRTSFLDFQYGERWLGRKLANHLQFGVGECGHRANLNRNWTTSVLLSRDKHNKLCSKPARRQYMV